MAEERKFTCYQDAVKFAHELEAQQPKALPQYESYSGLVKRNLNDVLGDRITNFKEAIFFMKDFALYCDNRLSQDRREKEKSWGEIDGIVCRKLGVPSETKKGQKWRLNTVKKCCEVLGIDWQNGDFEYMDGLKAFLKHIDKYKTSKKNEELAEFASNLYDAFVERKYIRIGKAA